MKTLWLFGDSFTDGHWGEDLYHTPSGSYKWDDEKYIRRTWGEDLKNLCQYDKVVNLARGGCSNFIILNTLIEHLNDIQPNDIVFIGTTANTRYTYCVPLTKDKMEPINWGVRYDLQLYVEGSDKLTNTWIPEAFSHIPKSKVDEIISFFTNHNVEDDSHIVLHNEIVSRRLADLHNTINTKLGAKAFIWDDKLWWYPSKSSEEFDKDESWGPHTIFETVYTWTNKISNDGHWSPNGYLLAAHFFNYCISNNIFHINTKELDIWYKSQGAFLKQSLEYVAFDPN